MREDVKHTLVEAALEIRSLRRANEIMGAKLEVLEQLSQISGFQRGPQGYSEDVAWKIDKLLEANDQTEKPDPA